MATPPTNPPTGTASPQIDSQQMQAAIQALTAAMKMFQDAITNINSNLSGTSSQATVAAAAVNQVAAAAQSSATSLSNNGAAVQGVAASHKELTRSMQQQHAWALIEIEDQKEKAAQLEDQAKKTRMLKNLALGGLSIAADLVQFWGKKVMAVVRYALVALNPLEYLETLGRLTKQYEDILRTIEQIRGEFGKLQQGTASFVFQTAKTVDSSLKSIGLSAYRILGTPSKVLEEMFSFMKDLGAAGSEAFRRFGATAINNLMIVQKGLGLTTDDAAFLAETAMSSGKSIDQVTTEIVKMSTAMGEKINESPKLIARSVVSAMKDLDKFGGATVKQLAKADAYMRKLGTTLDKTAALMSQFETIEGAAESSSKMAQYFGVTVDSFKLLMAQDPAQIADELRKGFRNAGVEVANFNRHGYALLAEATGLDAQTAKTVLSLMNQGAAYTDLAAASEGAAKSHMTEGEALNKIADSIERLVHASESNLFTNIFSAFSEGIMGIDTAKEAMQAFYDESMRLQELGMELSKTLYETFPGLKGIFESLKNILNGKYISGFFGDFTKEIGKFFKDISSGNLSFESAWESIKNKFFSYFDSASPEGKKLMKSIKEFLVGIKNTIIFLAKGITSEIVNALKGVNNPDAINNSADEFGSLLSFAFNDILGPIFSQLWDSFKTIVVALWERLAPEIMPMFKKLADLLGSFVGDFLIPALGKAFEALGPFIKGLVYTYFAFQLASGLTTVISAIVTKFGTAAAASAGGGFAATIPALTVALVLLVPLVAAFLVLALALAWADSSTVYKASIALLTIGLAMIEISAALWILSKVPVTDLVIGSMNAKLIAIAIGTLMLGVILFVNSMRGMEGDAIKAATEGLSSILSSITSMLLWTSGILLVLGSIGATGFGALIIGAGLAALQGLVVIIAQFLIGIGIAIAALAIAIASVPVGVIEQVGKVLQTVISGVTNLLTSINLFKPSPDLKEVFDEKSPASIPSIIKSLMTTAKEVMLAIGKEQINLGNVESFNKMFRVVVDILGALGGIIQSSTPNLEMMQQGGPQYLELLKTNSNNSVKILEQINLFVGQLVKVVQGNTLDSSAIASLSSFARVLSSLSPLIDVIKAVSAHASEVMKAYAEEDYVSDEDEAFYERAMNAPANFIQTMLTSLGGPNGLISSMISAFKGIDVKAISQDKVSSITGLLKGIGEFISGLMSGDMISLIKEIDNNTVQMQAELTKSFETSKDYWFFSGGGNEQFEKMQDNIGGNISQGLGRISGFISDLAKSVVPILKDIFAKDSVMDQIYAFTQRFDSKYIERFKLVTSLLQVVADITKSISPDQKLVQKLAETKTLTREVKGGTFSDDINEWADYSKVIPTYLDSLGNIGPIMSSFMSSFANAITQLAPALALMPPGSERKITAISNLMSTFATITSSIFSFINNSVNSLISAGTSGNAGNDKDSRKAAAENSQKLVEAIKSITSSESIKSVFDAIASNIPSFVSTLLTAVDRINLSDISPDTFKKMSSLTRVFQFVNEVMKTINESTSGFVNSGLKSDDKNTKTAAQLITDQIGNINLLFNSVFDPTNPDSVIQTLVGILGKFKTSDISGLGDFTEVRDGLKILGNTSKILKSMKETITNLPTSEISFNAAEFSSSIGNININTISKAIKDNLTVSEENKLDENMLHEFTKFSRFMNILSENGDSLINGVTKLNTLGEKITQLSGEENIIDKVRKAIGSTEGFEGMSTSFSDFLYVLADGKINILDDFQISLDALVTESKALNSELSLLKDNMLGLNSIQIKLPDLTPVAQPSGEMNIKQTKEFVAPNLNIQVNLDVKMDAGQIETAILNSSSSRINGFMNSQYQINARAINKGQLPSPNNPAGENSARKNSTINSYR